MYPDTENAEVIGKILRFMKLKIDNVTVIYDLQQHIHDITLVLRQFNIQSIVFDHKLILVGPKIITMLPSFYE